MAASKQAIRRAQGRSPIGRLRQAWNAADALLAKLNRWPLAGVGVSLLATIAALNFAAGRHVALSLFYFVPASLATWYSGRRMGVAFAGLAVLTWSAVDVFTGTVADYPGAWLAFVNAAVRIVFLLSIVALTWELRRSQVALWQLSRVDSLTGLPNRRQFDEALESESRRCHRTRRPFSLACIDLDDFKRINDDFGHPAGDAVLVEIASEAASILRETDLLARVGGDEFALLLPEADAGEAEEVARRFHERLTTMFTRSGWPTGASMGVVTFLEPPTNAAQAYERADELARKVKATTPGGIALATLGARVQA